MPGIKKAFVYNVEKTPATPTYPLKRASNVASVMSLIYDIEKTAYQRIERCSILSCAMIVLKCKGHIIMLILRSRG